MLVIPEKLLDVHVMKLMIQKFIGYLFGGFNLSSKNELFILIALDHYLLKKFEKQKTFE